MRVLKTTARRKYHGKRLKFFEENYRPRISGGRHRIGYLGISNVRVHRISDKGSVFRCPDGQSDDDVYRQRRLRSDWIISARQEIDPRARGCPFRSDCHTSSPMNKSCMI